MNKVKMKLKQLLVKLTSNVNHIKKDIECRYVWYGNEHGGFYACPDFLDEDSIIYSFGIGEDLSFDKAIIDKHKCNGYGFDPTPKSIEWIKHQTLSANFSFYPVGIGCNTEFVNFYLPENHDYVSGRTLKHVKVSEKRIIQVQRNHFLTL